MVSALETPKRSAASRPSRSRARTDGPPLKKRRYIPGGPGGGGRYVDDDGTETPVGGTGPGGYLYTGPRGRVGRMNAENRVSSSRSLRSPNDTYTRPRRERPPARPRYSSAAAAAAAVADVGEYKPREERSWEEFHPDLDVEAEMLVFSADEVDGIISSPIKPSSTAQGLGIGQADGCATSNGGSSLFDRGHSSLNGTPSSVKAEKSTITLNDEDVINTATGDANSPMKRRPGRPPTRRAESMLHGLGSPPAPRIQPIPTHNPKERLNLPRPNYRTIETFRAFEEDHSVAVNYVDRSMAAVGYQESDRFPRSERAAYIRGGEASIEEELDLVQAMKAEAEGGAGTVPIGRVEYDMDEQDDRWLDFINTQRKDEQVEAIKPWMFEFTMTQIEKEWHALEKRIPKPNPKPPQTHRPRSSSAVAVNGEPGGAGEEQDTKCAICDDGDCENTNAIVFCDGCDLAVHQECYGVPFIPEGQWLCRKCQLGGRGSPFACIFCPNTDGAFKQTSTMKWSHLLCAIWIPEVTLGNTTFMEPVMDVEKVPKQRWKLTCYICSQKMGACIQCGNKNCFTAFHVTCARRARLFLKMKSSHGGPANLDANMLKAFCDKHCPSDWRRENDVELATLDAKDFYRRTMRDLRWPDSQQAALAVSGMQAPTFNDNFDDTVQTDDASGNKRKRTHPPKAVWRLPSGAPIVPQVVYINVEAALGKFGIRKRKDFSADACKYWTLKREARRGASLLKRLQLQMETFTSMEITRRNFAGMGAAGGPRLKRRIEFAEQLEGDMEQIRVQCENVKERETRKLEDIEILREILDTVYFPIIPLLWPILEKAQSLDPKNVFKGGLDELQTRLEERYYSSVKDFSADLGSVFSSVIGLDAISDAMESADQVNGTSTTHSTLTPEQKDKKKLARRIIKAVQGALEEALRKEAQLGNRPFDKELKDMADLEAILENRNRATHDQSIHHTDGDDAMDLEDPSRELTESYLDRSKPSGDNWSTRFDSSTKENNSRHKDEVTDEAAIRLQLSDGSETIAITGVDANEVVDGVATSIDVVPALSHSGSTNPSTTHPLTPPQAGDNLLEPIRNGGIPWYLQPFDISGTTVMEERWTGPEVLRDMSEELSEIEDEVLNQMVEDVDMAEASADTAGVAIATPAPQTATLKMKKKPKRKRPVGW